MIWITVGLAIIWLGVGVLCLRLAGFAPVRTSLVALVSGLISSAVTGVVFAVMAFAAGIALMLVSGGRVDREWALGLCPRHSGAAGLAVGLTLGVLASVLASGALRQPQGSDGRAPKANAWHTGMATAVAGLGLTLPASVLASFALIRDNHYGPGFPHDGVLAALCWMAGVVALSAAAGLSIGVLVTLFAQRFLQSGGRQGARRAVQSSPDGPNWRPLWAYGALTPAAPLMAGLLFVAGLELYYGWW